MMKKVRYIIVLLLSFAFVVPNVDGAANTLRDLRNELAALKAEKAANDAAKSKTQGQINAQNANIASANAAIEQAENDIITAKRKIEESNEKIDKTKEDSAELLIFYQIMQGDDEILEFVGGSTTITDLLMRSESINQIISYNQNKLTELEEEIEKNNQLQIELKNKEIELEEKKKEYQKSLKSLKNDLSSLVEVSLDINAQIKAQQELIDYYSSVGCKEDQLLSACVDIANSSKFLRPLDRGYISSGFGYRSFYLNGKPYSDYHNGYDIAGNSGGTPIYASAAGTVAAIINKASCGGNQVFLHVRVGGKAYTVQYAHLMAIKVKVGDKVTQQTVIGTVGGGGSTLKSKGGWDTCSTGYHLHYVVANGFYLGGGSEGYSSYNTFVSKCIVPPNLPSYGKWFYSRY